jgi:2-oxoglutarate dehydrogenase complex dehydrogenase (E1) component-like enzyme
VDIVCYRRMGHNEQDDPRVTLPLTYECIDHHPPVLEIYSKQLQVRPERASRVLLRPRHGRAHTREPLASPHSVLSRTDGGAAALLCCCACVHAG